MNKSWLPHVTQLNIFLDAPTTNQEAISVFGKELKDETLELESH